MMMIMYMIALVLIVTRLLVKAGMPEGAQGGIFKGEKCGGYPQKDFQTE